MEVVPEMVSLLDLQHQIRNKPGKYCIKSTHVPSFHRFLSVTVHDFYNNPGISEINSFIDAKPAQTACEISML